MHDIERIPLLSPKVYESLLGAVIVHHILNG